MVITEGWRKSSTVDQTTVGLVFKYNLRWLKPEPAKSMKQIHTRIFDIVTFLQNFNSEIRHLQLVAAVDDRLIKKFNCSSFLTLIKIDGTIPRILLT